MRYLHHSNQSDSLFMLTAAHLPTNLSVFGFRTPPPIPVHTQEILMRVLMFSCRLRVVLTFHLKLGLNLTLDVAVWVWRFLSKGIFAHLSQASALGQRLKILYKYCSGAVTPSNKIKPLLSPRLLLPPNWLRDHLTFTGCFDRCESQNNASSLERLLNVVCVTFLFLGSATKKIRKCNLFAYCWAVLCCLFLSQHSDSWIRLHQKKTLKKWNSESLLPYHTNSKCIRSIKIWSGLIRFLKANGRSIRSQAMRHLGRNLC